MSNRGQGPAPGRAPAARAPPPGLRAGSECPTACLARAPNGVLLELIERPGRPASLERVVINCSDLARSLHAYCRTRELEVNGGREAEDRRSAVLVENAHAARAELRARGVECPPPVWLEMGPEIPIDGLWAVFFPDPDGTCLELIQSPRVLRA